LKEAVSAILKNRPEILIIADGKTNRDFPNVNAGILAGHWEIPVIDFNSNPDNKTQRLPAGYSRWGIVAPSHVRMEIDRIIQRLKAKDHVICESANGPIDIQCCYPFYKSKQPFLYNETFSDNMSRPEYERFDTFDHILRKWQRGDWLYPLMTSLGCPFGCIYCACRRRPLRFRSVFDCIDELKTVRKIWGIKRFMVVDDCFNADIKHAKGFAEAVTRLNLEWMVGNGLRADRFDKELGKMMRKAGCRWVAFGVETVDDNLLTSIQKGESFEQIDKAIREAKPIFDYVNVFLILGLPSSSCETDRRSIAWAKSRQVHPHISFYVPLKRKEGIDEIFDRSEGRKLPVAYAPEQQLELYLWART
jgi:hypothetical protein